MKKNELTTFDKISISDIKQEVKRSYKLNNNEKNSKITKELDLKMQIISTRQARFNEMSLDEKLGEIGNLIENLLKKEGKYLSLNYSDFSLGFIDNDDVIKLRKTVQCLDIQPMKVWKKERHTLKYKKSLWLNMELFQLLIN